MHALILRFWGRWPIRVVESVTHAANLVMMWRERARQRCTLASLDDRMLSDIGLGRAEIEREADKPPWRS
jgi:uncharacterized protein YjiS (DUF1127 family)